LPVESDLNPYKSSHFSKPKEFEPAKRQEEISIKQPAKEDLTKTTPIAVVESKPPTAKQEVTENSIKIMQN
jgi:hypothetical protein